jgi:hypothetical protein
MRADEELGAWQRQWQSAAAENDGDSVAGLRQRVMRESRRMKIGLLAPAAVTVGIGGAVLLRALDTLEPSDFALAIGVWIAILIAWAGSLWIAHGTWQPLGETTAAYVDLAIRRCRSGMLTAKFGAVLYVAQFLFILLWKIEVSAIGVAAVLTGWPVVVLGWIGFPLYLVWLGWFLRRKGRELGALVEMQEQIDGGS